MGQFDIEPTYISEKDKVFHSFRYYMGETIVYTDGRGDHKVSTNLAKDAILGFVSKTVVNHGKRDSQWETDTKEEKNTCDYKITVKHLHDPSIEIGEKVYPFNASKKLYQVKGEYVKASCGGNNILSAWEGKKDNECFMIDNNEKEQIVKKRFIRDDIAEIVLDTKYGTHWQDNVNAESMNWYVAKNYCNNLELGGYTNWSLPLFSEMFDPIIYSSKNTNEIDEAFKNLEPNLYWSSAIYSDPELVLGVASVYHYGVFRAYEFDTRILFKVRCVSR
jgi:hypothetical protein